MEQYSPVENLSTSPTHAETAAPTESAVVSTVFKTIFVDAIKDFFLGIFHFFRRYANHYKYCFKYLWNPTLRNASLAKLNWKENCQQSFELSLLVLVAFIFMVKLAWMPKSSEQVMDMLGDDINQMGVEAVMFVLLALSYVFFVILSILTGRLLRIMFEIKTTRTSNDILFTYLNNVIFSLTVIVALLLRFSPEVLQTGTEMQAAIWVVFSLLYVPLLLVWSFRFGKTNGLSNQNTVLFTGLTIVPFAVFYGYESTFITSLLFNI